MIQCQKCGQNNAVGSNFCRFCGIKFDQMQEQESVKYDQNQRRPYSWKTDEISIDEKSQNRTAQINRVDPLLGQHQNTNQPIVYPTNPEIGNRQLQPQYQNTLSTGYHCPFCNTNALPIVVKKVSPTGWAVFTVLLITTLIFFWIGLLIQEERRICPVCNMRVA